MATSRGDSRTRPQSSGYTSRRRRRETSVSPPRFSSSRLSPYRATVLLHHPRCMCVCVCVSTWCVAQPRLVAWLRCPSRKNVPPSSPWMDRRTGLKTLCDARVHASTPTRADTSGSCPRVLAGNPFKSLAGNRDACSVSKLINGNTHTAISTPITRIGPMISPTPDHIRYIMSISLRIQRLSTDMNITCWIGRILGGNRLFLP